MIFAPCSALFIANIHNVEFSVANKHSCSYTAMAQVHCSSV